MSLYLSRLVLNAHHKRTQSELKYPYELHRTICQAWSNDYKAARVLFRCEQDSPANVTVIVQSMIKPDWSRLDVSKEYLCQVDGPKLMNLQGLQKDILLRFRLRCRPSKRIGARDDRNIGKRMGLTTRDEIFKWLHRKANAGGFTIRDTTFDRVYWYDSRGGVQNKPLGAIVFDGHLVITEPDRFRQIVHNGIGTQKAFGFGLLSIAPVR